MPVARHPMPPEVAALSLDQIAAGNVARFDDRVADWNAFEDAKIEGYHRCQRRYIGAGASGKHDDGSFVPSRGFTLAVLYVEPGQGNAAHTHEVEEAFFVLDGELTTFLEDGNGERREVKLRKWDCIVSPPGVIHGFVNKSDKPVYLQVMLGRGRPETMGYADDTLFARRDAHLVSASKA